jgi:16S rRNA (uracil1498-N3)-methyltransferase
VLLFNGAEGEWACTVAETGKRGAMLRVLERTREQVLPPDLTLLFAPVKRHGTDLIVEKATELGVRALQPVLTRRTQSEIVRTDRLRAIATEAAEQTERLDVPDVRDAAPLTTLLASWDSARPLLFADEAGEAASVPVALSGVSAPRLALLTGPEGGFDPEERRLLRSLPYVTPVSLGPRILRAETAAIAALALIQAHWGDW